MIRRLLVTVALATSWTASVAGVPDFSTNSNLNNSAPPDGFPENAAPSVTNDVVRQLMASVAIEAQINRVKYLNSVTGTNTITASMAPPLTAYSAGMMVIFTPAGSNTGATTLAINGLLALDIQKFDGDALIPGDLVIGIPAMLMLDAGADDWLLVNPQGGVLSNGVSMSDLARLSQANTFPLKQTFTAAIGGGSAASVYINSSIAALSLNESDASVDNKRYDLIANGEQLCWRLINDADSIVTNFMCVDRTGTTVDSIALSATAITLNGVASSDFARLSQANTFTAIPAFNGGTSGVDAPFTVDSTFVVTNLNADLLDGNSSAAFATASHAHSAADITSGTLAVARGGTGTTTSTGTGSVVLSASPALTGTPTVDGTSVKNGALFTSIPSSGVLSSGTYTPTLTNGTNVSASTTHQAVWSRVGNVVSVSGLIEVDPTNVTSLSIVNVSLPVASNITNNFDVGGAGTWWNQAATTIYGGTASDVAVFEFVSQGSSANQTLTFTFQYLVQ